MIQTPFQITSYFFLQILTGLVNLELSQFLAAVFFSFLILLIFFEKGFKIRNNQIQVKIVLRWQGSKQRFFGQFS